MGASLTWVLKKPLSPTVCNNRIFLLGFRFPPSSPLKPYPKKPLYQRDVIKFPEWNDPPPGTSQENIPVRPIVMVSAWIKDRRLIVGSILAIASFLGRGSQCVHGVAIGELLFPHTRAHTVSHTAKTKDKKRWKWVGDWVGEGAGRSEKERGKERDHSVLHTCVNCQWKN